MITPTADLPRHELIRIRNNAAAQIAQIVQEYKKSDFGKVELEKLFDFNPSTSYADRIFGIQPLTTYIDTEVTTDSISDNKNRLILDSVHEYVRAGQVRKASVTIHRRVNELLEAQDFQTCDALLDMVNPSKEPLKVLLSFLMSTVNFGDKLPARSSLFTKISKRFFEDMPEEAEAILSGLEN